MNKFYIAIQVKENNKYYAYVQTVSECDNIVSTLKIKNIVSANLYHTKKKAKEVVDIWNEEHKKIIHISGQLENI